MCELADHAETTYPTARKRHACCECNRPILPGSEYQRVQGVWDGKWWTFKTHHRCNRVRLALMSHAAHECLEYGQMRSELSQRSHDRHRAPDWRVALAT